MSIKRPSQQAKLGATIAYGLYLMGVEIEDMVDVQGMPTMRSGVTIADTWHALRSLSEGAEGWRAVARPVGHKRPRKGSRHD